MMKLYIGEIEHMAEGNKYLLLLHWTGQEVGIKADYAIRISKKARNKNSWDESNFIGCRPCTFHEYISHKLPFLLTT